MRRLHEHQSIEQTHLLLFSDDGTSLTEREKKGWWKWACFAVSGGSCFLVAFGLPFLSFLPLFLVVVVIIIILLS